MIRSVVIIGSGNLAEALARAVAASPLGLRQVFGRNRDRVAAVAALSGTVGESDPSRLARADIYLIAVSDAAVAEVASSLPIDAAAVVAHTAGSVPVDALARFPRRAVFYPFQTFTKGREVDFSEIPILVETASPDLRGGAALVIAGLMAKGVTEIYNPETIARGYEHLESKLNALGSVIRREPIILNGNGHANTL